MDQSKENEYNGGMALEDYNIDNLRRVYER
jgi:hypothetical protein